MSHGRSVAEILKKIRDQRRNKIRQRANELRQRGIFKAIDKQKKATGRGFLTESIEKVQREPKQSILDIIFKRLFG